MLARTCSVPVGDGVNVRVEDGGEGPPGPAQLLPRAGGGPAVRHAEPARVLGAAAVVVVDEEVSLPRLLLAVVAARTRRTSCLERQKTSCVHQLIR